MRDKQDLLIEIGTEELPPTALNKLSEAFLDGVCSGLAQQQLHYHIAQPYASPRRLAVLVKGVDTCQADQVQERRGPALSAAFANDKPTKAALGFAASCGVAIEQLEKLETDKGAWLVFREPKPGQATAQLIPDIVRNALAALPIPKRMRWGSSNVEFVRPVHWVVLMLGNQVIPAEILGITSGRETRGHRFHHPAPLVLAEPAQYHRVLEEQGRVIAIFAQRRNKIRVLVEEAAELRNAHVVHDDALLDEVTGLVEWPVAVTGEFPSEFLQIPSEALVAVMKGHQKYFPLQDQAGKLLPAFITISNLESRNPAAVRAGNERVILPRLTDAAFFWNQDRAHTLESRLAGLAKVVFEQRLGTLSDKSLRVSKLCGFIASQLGEAETLGIRAGLLCKCDQLTHMVGEFPELQGIMGEYYARHDGENAAVAIALREQYMPKGGGAELPATRLGQALALADRCDTLVGIFGIGQTPSGDKDPYGLRRAAIGILRICIEQQLDVALAPLLAQAVAAYPAGTLDPATLGRVETFIWERMPRYCQELGAPADVIDAVLSCAPAKPLDAARRIHDTQAFRDLPDAQALAAANKRIHNILKKNQETLPGTRALPNEVNPAYFIDPAERQLYDALQAVAGQASALIQAGDYLAGLKILAGLRSAVDSFFDSVMVMDDNAQVRTNRLTLLHSLRALFLQVADISKLQST